MLVRAYFASAYGARVRTTSTGRPTNAVMGFLQMLLSAIDQFQPSHLFVAWDVSRDTFRREWYPAYKGTRGELPDDMLCQFDTAQEVLDAFAVRQASHERFEADDLIGSMADLARSAGQKVTILTGDRDALQLVGDGVTVAIMKKGVRELVLYTPDTLYAEYGLAPEQMIDLKGLTGDNSDNIPGVPGIGPKTAIALLLEHGSAEQALAAAPSIRGKVGEKLRSHAHLVHLSKRLATIVRDAPLPFAPGDCRLAIQRDNAMAKLAELELHHIQAQLSAIRSVV